ncbi:hypothetical protein [Actinacidiphila oryziradicis]|jgi:hypothetical protein|uniref:hypothetical protein n=1 Tax=Actinacidiphila oryziradicis TaxID=2571141 RepID=UPI003211CB07|nr:hypothetical protein [Actinacidiphila oryziradicis]
MKERREAVPHRVAQTVAVLLGLVLLAAPVGGVVLYGGAREEATQQMLLGRLDQADRLVQTVKDQPFATAEPYYRKALTAYRDLSNHHPDSRAAQRVPDRLHPYYTRSALRTTSRTTATRSRR